MAELISDTKNPNNRGIIQHQDGPYHFVVRPRQSQKLDVGEYPTEDAIPKFSFEYLPDDETITKHEARVPTSSGIRVVYHLENYGERVVFVTVRPATP